MHDKIFVLMETANIVVKKMEFKQEEIQLAVNYITTL